VLFRQEFTKKARACRLQWKYGKSESQ